MKGKYQLIVFIDNSLHTIFKSINALQIFYKGIKAFNNTEQALDFIYSNDTDILFINLDLIPNDSITIIKELLQKKLKSKPFIILYSDKQDDFLQELAFNAGVDSFINFHNNPAILQLFIKNLLFRRKKISQTEEKKEILIDKDRYLVLTKGEPVQLPRKEFKIFELLYNNPQKFFSKLEIALEIWEDSSVAGKRIIDVHIYNIRQFFGKQVIQSQKGIGYKINSKFI